MRKTKTSSVFLRQCFQNILLFCVFVNLCTGCASSSRKEIDPTNLHQLQNMSVSTVPSKYETIDSAHLRTKALQDTALSLGAQGGLAFASKQICDNLEKDKRHLENIFNFNAMMLSHGVLPPVLEQGDNSLNQDDPNTIRIADKTYRIVKQAHFATTPPNWREYLWLPYNKPELPDKVLLPRDSAESRIWRKAINLGWERGVQQAYNIFQQNLARLKRDYQGMVLYRKLLQEKMINPPFVSKTNLGVTGDGDVMRINDQVLRITQLPHLQTDSNGWRAVVVKQ